MDLDQRLVDAAVDQLNRRWPNESWAVAAAVYLDDGRTLTSVGLDNLNAGAALCAEAGALCQAYTIGRRVTASACVSKQADGNGIAVLAPCGICQERLALWGPEVQVAVPDRTTAAGWTGRTLAQINPFYWGTHFTDGDAWPSTTAHRA